MIQTWGLEDCGELLAMATPAQLQRVFDLDLWRAPRPGVDERLDADRFGIWLDVLMESGASSAAQKLAGMDADLVAAALAQHLRVFDRAAVSPFTTLDGEEVAPLRLSTAGLSCEAGGYVVVARRTGSWDTIVELLLVLDSEHHDYFTAVMRTCRSLSNSTPERDGMHDLLDEREQDLFDLAFDRERRRDKQGYVTPAQAGAFLQMARGVRLDHEPAPRPDPIASAYLRAIETAPPALTQPTSECSALPPAAPAAAQNDSADAIAAVIDLLQAAGVLTEPRRALPGAPHHQAPRLERIQKHLHFVGEYDSAAHFRRTQELVFLANTILAACSVQGRRFTEREASDAAFAVCNLGLENWPAHWGVASGDRFDSAGEAVTPPDGFLVDHDLISVFQVGWTVLHTEVSMYTAERLIGVLADMRSDDGEILAGLDALHREMARQWRAGTPWRASEALDAILIVDQPAWATLLGLVAEYPVIHAAMVASRHSRRVAVGACDCEFISENSQIASVHRFVASLPERLRC